VTTYPDPGHIADVVGTSGSTEATWANAVRDRMVHRFASLAARAAAIPSPKEGMACYVTDQDAYYFFNGVRWMAWDHVLHTYAGSLIFSGGGGSAGNATIVAVMQRRADLCLMKVQAIWGSTTVYGAGTLALGCPFSVHTSYRSYGVGFVTDVSAGTDYPVFVRADNNGTAAYAYTNNGLLMSSTTPFTPAPGDEFAFQLDFVRGTYGADEGAT